MHTNKPTLYFLCPDQKQPTGGVKQIYRQVDVLNKNGFDAKVVHAKKGFRVKWFKNQTPIIHCPYLFFKIHQKRKKGIKYTIKNFFKKLLVSKTNLPSKDSILVFPEIYGVGIGKDTFQYKKVIFNQNCYYTFDTFRFGFDTKNNPYTDENTLGCIVVSEDSKEYLNYAFPNLKIERVFLGIKEIFFAESTQPKKKQIAYMPRKLKQDITQIIYMLKDKDFMKDWQWCPIENKSENEVAQILKESTIYLSTNHIEGFGLPPAEAMASGCFVIGYAGNGGMEYFHDTFCSKIPDGNIVEFVKAIENAVKIHNQDPTFLIKKGNIAADFIKNTYNMKNEEYSIVNAWKNLLENL